MVKWLSSRPGVDPGAIGEPELFVSALPSHDVFLLWRLDAERQILLLEQCRGVSPDVEEPLRALPLERPALACAAVRARRVQYAEDASAIPHRYEPDWRLANAAGLSSWVVVPLAATRRVVGAVGCGLRRPRRFSHQDIQALMAVSALFAVAFEQAELLAATQHQLEASRQQQARRAQFVSVVAHELVGSLTAILIGTQLLRHYPRMLVDRRREVEQRITAQVRRMERLSGDLLDVSRIASGHFPI